MIPNGLVLFQGGKNPFKAGPGAVLTDLIDALTHSDDSHTAMQINGKLYESTIAGGVSGPQISDLGQRVTEYSKQGGHAHLLPFLPQFEPDWDAMTAGALQMIALREEGQMPYNVKRLFGDAVQRSIVFDLAALPADGILAYLADHSMGVVCSEMAAFLIQYGLVVPKLTAAGIPWLPHQHGQPIGCSPQDLANTPAWATPIQLI
jgi:hypothetical protein